MVWHRKAKKNPTKAGFIKKQSQKKPLNGNFFFDGQFSPVITTLGANRVIAHSSSAIGTR